MVTVKAFLFSTTLVKEAAVQLGMLKEEAHRPDLFTLEEIGKARNDGVDDDDDDEGEVQGRVLYYFEVRPLQRGLFCHAPTP